MPITDVLLTHEIRALVGRPMWNPETALVREEDILRYVEMLGEEPSRDADGRWIAPPLYLPSFHHGGSIGKDGRRTRPGEIVIDAPVQNRVMGGCAVEFDEPIKAGDIITASTTISDIYEKRGRTGPMLFIVTETTYRNQHGNTMRSETWTIIRR